MKYRDRGIVRQGGKQPKNPPPPPRTKSSPPPPPPGSGRGGWPVACCCETVLGVVCAGPRHEPLPAGAGKHHCPGCQVHGWSPDRNPPPIVDAVRAIERKTLDEELEDVRVATREFWVVVKREIRYFVHNVVAHPLLALCPPVGRWLHDATIPPPTVIESVTVVPDVHVTFGTGSFLSIDEWETVTDFQRGLRSIGVPLCWHGRCALRADHVGQHCPHPDNQCHFTVSGWRCVLSGISGSHHKHIVDNR